ncbi:MAG: hypothetical protein HQK81_14485 [Desulfovibrionaceae bacterium]|nr:hypothetical protein [Desulfovibrionaceae bacterium]
MLNRLNKSLTNSQLFLCIGAVFVAVFLVLAFVLSNAKAKPQSPQAMVAAALSGLLSNPNLGREWQPGMGPKPFLYHPAALTQPAWQPLPQAANAPAGAAQPGLAQPGGETARGWRPLPGPATQAGAR